MDRGVYADSLLRWMEGPFKGTLSASVGPGKITSFPRSKGYIYIFFSLEKEVRFLVFCLPFDWSQGQRGHDNLGPLFFTA